MGDCVVETPKENIMKEKYRGPPPRKDLIPSPNKERDWKGNSKSLNAFIIHLLSILLSLILLRRG